MNALKTNFSPGIASLLKEMLKTFTSLSKRVASLEKDNKVIKLQNELVAKQQREILNNLKSLSNLQGEIARQVVSQHESLEQIYITLGLKKDLSYYSFDMMNAEEH